MKLHISDKLTLPQDIVTSTLVVYGAKGVGKSHFGAVLVEEMTNVGLRWSYLDPLGVTWGLRHSKNGKGPGIECIILGGVHGDIPIEPTGGQVVADFVVDEPVNVIVDFSRKPSGEMWSIGEKVRFITEYAKRVFQRQGSLLTGRRREPFFQILDEAARYIPQIIPHGSPQLAECVGAWETLVEEGRNIGIGVGLLTQRSARMNKSVSELADAMFAFRTVGPNSIGAITDWLGEHVPKQRIHEHIETLRSLERGHCLVVSPGWLRFEGVVIIRDRQTFDSSATPKPGERPKKVTGQAAKPDLKKYLERMKETIEKIAATDPKKLQAQVRELYLKNCALESKLAERPKSLPTKVAKVSEAEIRRVLQDELEPWRDFAQKVRRRLVEAEKLLADAAETGAMLGMKLGAHRKAHGDIPDYPKGNVQAFDVKPIQKKFAETVTPAPKTFFLNEQHELPRPRKLSAQESNGDLPYGEKLVLTACAQFPNGLERRQLTVLTGFKRSTRDAYVLRLKNKGYVEDRGKIHATPEGVVALGDYTPIPTGGKELQDYWRRELPEGERQVLEVLLAAQGAPVDREAIDQATGYKRSSRDAYLNRLGAKELVESIGRGQVKASTTLFS